MKEIIIQKERPEGSPLHFYMLYSQIIRGWDWAVCGWLSDDAFKIFAFCPTELIAKTIVQAMEFSDAKSKGGQ